MSLMLIKRGIEVLVGAVLMVALLTVLPAVAQAQEEGATSSPVVVVKPGDTLWSISEERLGPEATPQQIAGEVERIYALNQDQIGPDPSYLLPGQELSLPAAGGSSADKPAAKKTAQAATKGAAEGERIAKGQASDEQANLPKVPASAAVPTVESPSSDTPPSVVAFAVRSAVAASLETLAEARTTAEGRRLLGGGIIALTLLICALMAWKLPMRRYIRDDNEAWGIYAPYPADRYHYAYPAQALDLLSSSNSSSAQSAIGSKAQATAAEKGASPVGLGRIAQKRRSQLISPTSSMGPLPHNKKKRSRRRRRSSSSAVEAHTAEARRLLRGAVLKTRARKPRRSGLLLVKTARRRAASGGGR